MTLIDCLICGCAMTRLLALTFAAFTATAALSKELIDKELLGKIKPYLAIEE